MSTGFLITIFSSSCKNGMVEEGSHRADYSVLLKYNNFVIPLSEKRRRNIQRFLRTCSIIETAEIKAVNYNNTLCKALGKNEGVVRPVYLEDGAYKRRAIV